jgi:acyl carrier protein
MNTHDRLIGILASEYKLQPDQLQPAARLDELGVDSLGVMELLFKIEDEFQIQVPADQVQLATVGDVVAYIDGLLAQRDSAEARPQAQS